MSNYKRVEYTSFIHTDEEIRRILTIAKALAIGLRIRVKTLDYILDGDDSLCQIMYTFQNLDDGPIGETLVNIDSGFKSIVKLSKEATDDELVLIQSQIGLNELNKDSRIKADRQEPTFRKLARWLIELRGRLDILLPTKKDDVGNFNLTWEDDSGSLGIMINMVFHSNLDTYEPDFFWGITLLISIKDYTNFDTNRFYNIEGLYDFIQVERLSDNMTKIEYPRCDNPVDWACDTLKYLIKPD